MQNTNRTLGALYSSDNKRCSINNADKVKVESLPSSGARHTGAVSAGNRQASVSHGMPISVELSVGPLEVY